MTRTFAVSLVGAAVLAVTPRIPEVRAVATVAAPSDLQHVRGMLLAQAPDLEAHGEAEVRIASRSFQVGRELVVRLPDHRVDAYPQPSFVGHAPVEVGGGERRSGVVHGGDALRQALFARQFDQLSGFGLDFRG